MGDRVQDISCLPRALEREERQPRDKEETTVNDDANFVLKPDAWTLKNKGTGITLVI